MLERGVLKQGVLERGELKRGVLKRRMLKRGVLKRGVSLLFWRTQQAQTKAKRGAFVLPQCMLTMGREERARCVREERAVRGACATAVWRGSPCDGARMSQIFVVAVSA